MKKRFLSTLLVLTMVLSLFSAMNITVSAVDAVEYLKPVYVDENDVTKGITGMTAASCSSYTTVDSNSKN